MRTTDKKRAECGTQVVELALVLPVLLFFVLAVSEGAGMIRAHQILNNAAREGARLSTLQENSGNITFLQDAVTCYLIRNGVTPPAAQVPSSCPTSAKSACSSYAVVVNQGVLIPNGTVFIPASQVVVSCGYELHFLPRLASVGVSGVVPLGATAEFRNFYAN